MSQPKMNPGVLRLLVIFPNVLSYLLLFGVIIFIVTNFNGLKEAGSLNFWLIVLAVIAPTSIVTSISIVKRIRSGAM